VKRERERQRAARGEATSSDQQATDSRSRFGIWQSQKQKHVTRWQSAVERKCGDPVPAAAASPAVGAAEWFEKDCKAGFKFQKTTFDPERHIYRGLPSDFDFTLNLK
jgi:hypothetical protein